MATSAQHITSAGSLSSLSLLCWWAVRSVQLACAQQYTAHHVAGHHPDPRRSHLPPLLHSSSPLLSSTDDGALDLGEFLAFFGDGVMSTAELEKLFADIDTSGNKTIETEELSGG